MAEKIYQDYGFMYEHYVKRRLNLADIQKILKDKYMVEVTVQTLYNSVKKMDLLKFRGKGRVINANLGRAGVKRPTSPRQQAILDMKKRNRAQGKKRS